MILKTSFEARNCNYMTANVWQVFKNAVLRYIYYTR